MAERVIVARAANVFVTDATPDARLPGRARRAADRYQNDHGGLWVGGRVTLTTQRLAFHPNGVNRALQTGSLDVDIPLSAVLDVEVQPGFLTKIIAVRTHQSIIKLRCFGAIALAGQISTAAKSSGSADGAAG
jgi:hypothetical protein